ncbi:M20/M25/M40 family metallo-hydrolase [Rhodocaloribacter sp.]
MAIRWMGLVMACLLACVPGGVSRAQARVDGERLLRRVETLASDAFAGRATGTEGGAKARAYVRRAFADLGLEAFGAYAHPFRYRASAGRVIEGANVLGFVRGTERPDSFMVVSAHFDHLGVRGGEVYNGADDNASGVAVLLAAAAWFKDHPPAHSILFAAFDAEEAGLRGARAFMADPPVDPAAIVLDVNLDMVSRSAKGELFAAGTHQAPYLEPYLTKTARRSAVSLRFGHDRPELGHDDWTSASDHGVFHEAGIPFIYFGVEDHPDYHRPSDDFERISPEFFVAAAETILDALVTFDAHLGAIRAHAARNP